MTIFPQGLVALLDTNNVVQSVIRVDGVKDITVNPYGGSLVAVTAQTGPASTGFTFNAGIFVFGQTTQQQQSQNAGTLQGKLGADLARLRQIQTQAATFAAQAPYGTANLANLNDLLAKSQLIATAVGDLAADVIALGRLVAGQLDGTN